MHNRPLDPERLLAPESRSVFPGFARRVGALGVATYQLDSHIEQISKQDNVSVLSEPEIQRSLQPTIDNAYRVLEEVNPFVATRTWNHWYRLHARIAFAPKLVLARQAFAGHDMDRRQEIAYMSGDIATSIVESALINYQDDRTNHLIGTQIAGVISEYTGIAVANYIEDGGRMALPSSLYEDTAEKTDGAYYWTNEHGQNLLTRTQTKSMRRAKGELILQNSQQKDNYPERVVHFYADDFDNMGSTEGFRMSDMLVQGLKSNGARQNIEPKIEQATVKLWNIVRSQWTAQNSTDISVVD